MDIAAEIYPWKIQAWIQQLKYILDTLGMDTAAELYPW
jgi:hypothetical protein